MPTETDPWEHNAKLTGLAIGTLHGARGSQYVGVGVAGESKHLIAFSDKTKLHNALRYDWIFDATTGNILKTPNDTLVLRNGYSLNADGREVRALDGGTTFVAEDAIAVTGSNEPPGPTTFKDTPTDDGWSAVARLTGADVEALRQAAEHIGDGAVLVGGRAGDHVVGWMDRGEHSSEAKWIFDAKTARMLKGPGDGVLLPPGGQYHPPKAEREVTEVEQARAAIVRRIIAAGDDEVDEIETLAKAYDLLR